MNEIKKLNVIVFGNSIFLTISAASIQLKNKDLDSPIHQLWIWAIKMLYAQ
jgi:hypothetical protein